MATPLGIALNTLAGGGTLSTLTGQLASLIQTGLLDECSISRPEFTVGDYGSAPPSYETVASSVACSWAPLSKTQGAEYVRAGQINEVVPYTVTLPATADVKPKDRIVVVPRGDEPEHTFEVKAILRNSGLSLSVICTMEEQ
jgi:hypothetical protein